MGVFQGTLQSFKTSFFSDIKVTASAFTDLKGLSADIRNPDKMYPLRTPTKKVKQNRTKSNKTLFLRAFYGFFL